MENLDQRIAQIVEDREHGSRWLVRAAILLLRELAAPSSLPEDEQMRLLYHSARQLAQARPSMAALASTVARIVVVPGGPAAVFNATTEVLQEFDSAPQRIAEHAEPFLHGHLLTCSLSGTVVDVLSANQQQISHVTVMEGRPRYEGREMARALLQRGFAITLITDAQADIFLQSQSQAVIVGADSILADGGILNKAGTALLAWAAHGHGIPVNVVSETLKISPHDWSSNPARLSDNLALLEEKEASEVWEEQIPGLAVRNFYFDYTPAHLLHNVITEIGVLTPQQIAALARQTRDRERVLLQKQA